MDEYIKEEILNEKDILIREDPYTYIINHYESMYKHIGSRIWTLLSLLPVSNILPKFNLNNRDIRIHLNCILLSPSGHGKSQTAREFEKITYNPLSTKEMTIPRLYHELNKNKDKKISLIVEDIGIWFLDDEKIKFLEGITGEESSFSHETMRNIKDTNKHIELISFCSGTPENITNKRLKEGILRRFSPLIILLSPQENEDVIDFILSGASKELRVKDSEEVVKFYQDLYEIQNGEHYEIPQITGYIMPSKYQIEDISKFIKKITRPLHENFSHNSATETEEFFRFAICHAFLNIFSRYKNGMVKDGKLIITEEDIAVAKKLIKREILNKLIELDLI